MLSSTSILLHRVLYELNQRDATKRDLGSEEHERSQSMIQRLRDCHEVPLVPSIVKGPKK